MHRKIIHVDADCFYAAIEMRDRPSLRNVPMAVGGSAQRRGVLTTCNYDARAFGIRSAMPTAQALRLCPHLKVIPPEMHKYREASKVMQQIFAEFTDYIEPLSLDEAYLEVTNICNGNLTATEVAKNIRSRIKEDLSITVSAGVSVNKFLAKVASDWQKPDGLTVISPKMVESFVGNLSVKKIPGVGSVTTRKLHRYGLETCSDLRGWSLHNLKQKFGKFGVVLYERARGMDERPVRTVKTRKSISVERTFSKDILGPKDWDPLVASLFTDLMSRINAERATDRIDKAFVKIKFYDFQPTTVERVGTGAFRSDFNQLLSRGWERYRKPIRLIGLGVRLTERPKLISESLPFDLAECGSTEKIGF